MAVRCQALPRTATDPWSVTNSVAGQIDSVTVVMVKRGYTRAHVKAVEKDSAPIVGRRWTSTTEQDVDRYIHDLWSFHDAHEQIRRNFACL